MAEYNYFNINEFDRRKFRFFKLYKYLLLDDSFAELSSDSKIAYSLFENRHQSSVGNSTYKDDKGRYFIFFSRQELIDSLNCSTHKAASIMKELLDFGLIERSEKLGGFSGKKDAAQYRLYVNDYVDFIKFKKKKQSNGDFDPMKSRDFIMIPFSLFDKDKDFFMLPTNVKITYSVLLNLALLSLDHDNYHDENGNIFVKFSVKELQAVFGGDEHCHQNTAKNYFTRLVDCGLIERAKYHAEHIIYVKNGIDSAGTKTDTTAGTKTCTQDRINNNISKQEIRQSELEKENFQSQRSVTTAKAKYKAEIYERFEFEDTLRLYSETLNYPEDMMKKFTAIFKAILNLIVWVKFIDEEINCGVLKVSSSDFSNAVEQLESSDVERIIFTIINSGIEYNNNYLLTSLYFATLTRSNVYET